MVVIQRLLFNLVRCLAGGRGTDLHGGFSAVWQAPPRNTPRSLRDRSGPAFPAPQVASSGSGFSPDSPGSLKNAPDPGIIS